MSCSNPCLSTNEDIKQTKEFIFAVGDVSIDSAITACKRSNATLATTLFLNDYSNFDRCCNGSSRGFRIGLLSSNNQCTNDELGPYYWHDVPNQCSTGSPLTLENPPYNCQSVQIFPGSPNENTLTNSKWISCDKRSSFICQRVLPPLIEAETTATAATIRQTTFSNTLVSPNNEMSIVIAVSVVTSCVIMLLLLFLLIFRQTKQCKEMTSRYSRSESLRWSENNGLYEECRWV